ncbi:hypothetical protein SteCoe_22012 [Stentor coeruleus]|uniref:Uncharacterized protein n=1 Tax=Stentor coeruleus TaxID=5963 RepID=A0A1R2BNC0_9CILI|nr:hypothetical protein SteCoe_22012 [Stentor coeruleus]
MSEKKLSQVFSKYDRLRKLKDNLLTKAMVSATVFLTPRFLNRKEFKEPNEDTTVIMLFSSISGFSSFC